MARSGIIQTMVNTYLDVPFKEKDEAKALGARWDSAARKWYVPEGKELTPFGAWLPEGSKLSVIASTGSNDQLPSQEVATQELAVPKKGISLSQLLGGVAKAISEAFKAGVWTIVDVVEARSKNGHVYLELSERTPDGNVLATARASIWASTANKILPEFEKATGASIAPGIKLLVRAKPVFKPQYGFSIEIDAIDPEYTLGDLEARKREIRTRLKQEGIFAANKKLAPPWDFNLVLVVAPQGAAGLGDFQAEAKRLERHGICRFVYAHSRFQGEGAAKEIRQTLLRAVAEWDNATVQPDAVVIIRGGGAVNDLAWLNDYELANMLCTLRYPVLTGIGHERDSTILDEVANTRFDTPSKVIAGIEQVIRKRVGEAKENFEALLSSATRGVNSSKGQIDTEFSAIQSGAVRRIAIARQTTTELMNELRLDTIRTVHEAKQESSALISDVRHGAYQLMAMAKSEVPGLFSEIRAEATNIVGLARTLCDIRMQTIRDRTALDINRSKDSIQSEVREVSLSAKRMIVDARKTSTALFREIAGQGPEKTLGRGFAIVRGEDGKPVTSAYHTESGNQLEIEFRDGRVTTQVK